jgi:NADH-quinone oxidoreductase subunit E
MSEAFDIRDILREAGGRPRDLIGILHRVQDRFGYIPETVLPLVARHVRTTPGEVYGVLTFYPRFHLAPPARHTLEVCLGTACHVRGGDAVAEELERTLGVAPGRSTPDGQFDFRTVNCLGCCAIGPVLRVDGRFEARVTAGRARDIVSELRPGGRKP